MGNLMNSPAEIIETNIQTGVYKVNYPLKTMVLKGIMAGAFIALAGAASSTASHAIGNVGAARSLAGAVFGVGLMLVLFMGADLFTGNCLSITAIMDKKVTWKQVIRNLIVIWFSNLIGALIIDVLLVYSGNLDYSHGLLGAYTIKVAIGKVAITPMAGLTSGILCNILVCFAVLMALTANDIGGKVWAIFFPILAFVICGFEHCVANMFYIPAGIMAKANPEYVEMAIETYGLTMEQIDGLNVINSLANFIPVTIGNIIGGMVFVGLPMYLVHRKK